MSFLRPVIFLLVMSFSMHLSAQELQNFTEDTLKLRSDFVDEVQTLRLYLPKSASGVTETYPVIYFLSEPEQLSSLKNIPKAIMVRLEATGSENVSDAYISFLEKELVYFMASHYATTGETVLVGEEQQGLLATEILLKRPDAFDNYILINPDFTSAGSLFQTWPTRPNDVPIVYFAGIDGKGKELQELQKKLENSYYNKDSVHLENFTNEDVNRLALENAFKILFKNK